MEKSEKLEKSEHKPRSMGILSDIKHFILKKPPIQTLIEMPSEEERIDYCDRIMQRLHITVKEYSVLNIHKIGIDVPVRYVFEEILKWDGTSTYWPNNLANVGRINGQLNEVEINLFGLHRIGFDLGKKFIGFRVLPLFMMKALRFKLSPEPVDFDNARYLLFNCSGGYPIGIISIYTRSSISEQGETDKSQVIFVVAFNFYGRKNKFLYLLVNRIWEAIHNRATANILNRIKDSYELKFSRVVNDLDDEDTYYQ